jgi:hypothetical protein
VREEVEGNRFLPSPQAMTDCGSGSL